MTYTEICARLDGHLQGMPNAPPIIFDNSPAVRPSAGVFLEAVNLPAVRELEDNCGSLRQEGIYSINIFSPLHGGSGAAARLADALAEHFSLRRLDGLFCAAVTVARIGQVGDYFVINAGVPWRTGQ